jgi:DNA-binding IclR family transcriptional regulator
MTEFEKNCYGMSTEDIRVQYMQSITAQRCGLEMVVMGLLSDAQELQTFGIELRTAAHAVAIDQSRKNMNIAKYILSEMLEQREAA